jgi:modification methylase
MKAWQRSMWPDLRGASTRDGHPAPFPVEVAERLIKLFSFAVDNFLRLLSIISGRNSIANEIEPAYVEIAQQRNAKTARQHRHAGAIEGRGNS